MICGMNSLTYMPSLPINTEVLLFFMCCNKDFGVGITPTYPISKGFTMSSTEQLRLIMEAIEEAKREGKQLTIEQAQRKLHREYITRQLWNLHGLYPKGFLVASGLKAEDEEDGFTLPDPNYDSVFNNYLNMKNKLTGARGIRIREALERFGIDYLSSPTFPLEPLDDRAA